MELNYKKIGLLSGFVVLVAVLAFLLYTLFFRATTPSVVAPDAGVSGAGQLPSAREGAGGVAAPAGSGRLPAGETVTDEPTVPPATPTDTLAQGGLTATVRLTQTPAAEPVAAPGGGVRYYSPQSGTFYGTNGEGVTRPLTDKVFFNASRVAWAPGRDKAVIEYPDGANIVYDFHTKQQFSLPKHWQDFNFSPDGAALVAKSIGSDPGNRWLIVTNIDGSQARAVEPIGDNDANVYPSWSPNNLSVAMYTESIDFDRQRLYFVGQHGENFKSTVVNGRGFEHEWDPSGESIIYSVYSSGTGLKPTLWTVDAKGETIGANRRTLGVETWAHKCAFADAQTLYCAVPDTLPDGAGLFPELAQTSVDSLYRIDVTTGTQELIAVPDGAYNIAELVVSEDGERLYFTDTFSGELHALRL